MLTLSNLPPIVFVLGAGASWPCGFPLGSELVRNIIGRTDIDHIFDDLGLTHEYRGLKVALRKIGNQSIDDLLYNREDLRAVGRAAIAYEILSLEDENNFHPTGDDDNRANDRWYSTLFAYLRRTAPTWDEFQQLPIRFVTFNYDRSFERYLGDALLNQFNPSPRGVLYYLARNPVLHIHGQVGFLPLQGAFPPAATPFGGIPIGEDIERVMDLISIPVEPVLEDNHEVKSAQASITAASAIFFLGFRFDQSNFAKLGPLPNNPALKLFYTLFGEGDEERRRVREDVLENRSAYAGEPKMMNRAFLNKYWPLYTTDICKEWGGSRTK